MHLDEIRPGQLPGVSIPGGRHVIDPQIATALDTLAERIARIKAPSSRNPHAFHEDRSEVAHEARSIATWLRTGRKPAD
jgi:hypothetical protein